MMCWANEILLIVTPPEITSQRKNSYPAKAVAFRSIQLPCSAAVGNAQAVPHAELFTFTVIVRIALKCALTETLLPGITNDVLGLFTLPIVIAPEMTSQRSNTNPVLAVAVIVTNVPCEAVAWLALTDPCAELFTLVDTLNTAALKIALTETLLAGIVKEALAEFGLLIVTPPDRTSQRSNTNPVFAIADSVTRVPWPAVV
jgi:hypothetical protein